MKTHNLTVRKIEAFRKYLVEEEKSEAAMMKFKLKAVGKN